MHGSVGLRVCFGLLTLAVLLAGWGLGAWNAAAQSLPAGVHVVDSDPAPNARLFSSPEQIALTTVAPIAPSRVRMRLIGAGNVELPLVPETTEREAVTRTTARLVSPLGPGDYTVVWTARDGQDGVLFAGAYPFVVGAPGPLGQVTDPDQWPTPWMAALRWLVFMGTAVAGGGFAWGQLLNLQQNWSGAGGRLRSGVMAGAALAALLAASATPVLAWRTGNAGESFAFVSVFTLSLGWRIQILALAALTILCLALLVRGEAGPRNRRLAAWAGAAAGGVALAGLGLESRFASLMNVSQFAIEVLHLWTAALWLSGTLFFVSGWRGMGTDVARFRRVRWLGGLLLAAAIVSGAMRAEPTSLMGMDFSASGYAQALSLKVALVLAVAALGGVAMLGKGRANAVQVSRFLGAQAVGAGLAALLSAAIALMAPPGTAAQMTLAGVALADMVSLDESAFGVERGMIHLLTQPSEPGGQTVVVRITDSNGMPVTPDAVTNVAVEWTPLNGEALPGVLQQLEADPSGAVFTGAATFGVGWQQADVMITPPGGIASRAQFTLIAPDPNVSGVGPEATGDEAAQALYSRGAASLAALQSVRYARRAGDGSGAMTWAEVSLRSAEGERPAAYAETVIGTDRDVTVRQVMIGDQRWIEEHGVWSETVPVPFAVPARWADNYAGAFGFELGPREAVDGELSQVVTFQTPADDAPAREPAWHAWWVGLASGQVRREAVVSSRRYEVTKFWDFNAAFDLRAPEAEPVRVGSPVPGASPTPRIGQNFGD